MAKDVTEFIAARKPGTQRCAERTLEIAVLDHLDAVHWSSDVV
jgi:hypothetical protein